MKALELGVFQAQKGGYVQLSAWIGTVLTLSTAQATAKAEIGAAEAEGNGPAKRAKTEVVEPQVCPRSILTRAAVVCAGWLTTNHRYAPGSRPVT